MVLLTIARGISVITEKVYPDRFMHAAELNRMGAFIKKEGPNAIVVGVEELSGAPVMASDLRASAALVIAGMTAKGITELNRIYHIDRGYEGIEKKLNALGASIKRVDV
jgi:UDP-N-acetylglucosamine 1-carboxyvinyltransferase